MKKLLIYSQCQRSSKKGAYFHFKGYYRGERVNYIWVEGEHRFELKKEYLLWVSELRFSKGLLEVKVLATKEV
ncbi:MAG: hypothetical protein L6Q33_03265 [Bacteriovoracaceae bacterium]|nr:hypothetical protein [Bacteriovoracaceae bacterium]